MHLSIVVAQDVDDATSLGEKLGESVNEDRVIIEYSRELPDRSLGGRSEPAALTAREMNLMI